jgi:methylmalonyl-CoA/ethylmalonyl-CoA epimerase
MTNDELRELNKRRKIHQIAWVTRDLEKSMKAWVENLKVGPWTVLTFTEKTLKYLDVDGKRVTEPFKFLIGISWIGEIQVELIQPVYGPMIYEAFIRKHGEGLHHRSRHRAFTTSRRSPPAQSVVKARVTLLSRAMG